MHQKQKKKTAGTHSWEQTRQQTRKKLKKLGKAAVGTLVAGSLMAGTLFTPVDDNTAVVPEQVNAATSVVAVLEQPSAPAPAEEEKRRNRQKQTPLSFWQRMAQIPLGVRIVMAAAVWVVLHTAASVPGSAAIATIGPVMGALVGMALTTAAVGGTAAVTAKMIKPDTPLKEIFRPGRFLVFLIIALVLAAGEHLAVWWLSGNLKAAVAWGSMVLETILLIILGRALYIRPFYELKRKK